MKIGVDCDGVLTDMSKYIFEYGEIWFKRKPDNPDGYSTAEIFGCTEKKNYALACGISLLTVKNGRQEPML